MGIRRPAILNLIPVALLATLYIFLHVSFSITPHSRQSVIPLLFDGVPVFALYGAAIAACGLAIPRYLYKAACAPFVLFFVLLLVLPVGFEVSVIQFSHGNFEDFHTLRVLCAWLGLWCGGVWAGYFVRKRA